MEKLSLNKLIANDIVNYGMDKTMNFNYIVSLNDFLDDYDEETKDYIKRNFTKIKDAISENENVAQFDYDEKRDEFDLVFYYDNLITPLEKKIIDKAKSMGVEYELDDLREMSYSIENSFMYEDLIIKEIENSRAGKEI